LAFSLVLFCCNGYGEISKRINQSFTHGPEFTTSAVSDDVGALWLGANSGLYYYDGVQLKPLNSLNNNLTDLRITDLTINQHQLLVSTQAGINLVNLPDQTSQAYTDKVNSNALGNYFIGSHFNRDLWWVTNRLGETRVFTQQLSLTKTIAPPKGFTGYAYRVVSCHSDQLFIATSEGLLKINKTSQSHVAERVEQFGKEVIVDIQCEQESLWVATNEKIYLLGEDKAKLSISDIGDADDRFVTFAIDQWNLYAGTFQGKIIEVQNLNLSDKLKLKTWNDPPPKIERIEIADEFTLRIHTQGDGMLLVQRQQAIFKHLSYESDSLSCVNTRGIYATKQKDKQVFISAFNDGVFKIDVASGVCSLLTTERYRKSFQNVYSLALGDGDNVFVGSAGVGLYQWNGKKLTLVNSNKLEDYAFNNINDIYLEGEKLYLASMLGLIEFYPESRAFNVFRDSSTNSALINRIQTITPLDDFFILGTDFGLVKFDRRNGSFQSFSELGEVGTVYAFAELENRNYLFSIIGKGTYIATINKRYELENIKKISSISSYSFVKDNQGRIWAGTEKGIYLWADHSFFKIGEDFGLEDVSYEVGASISQSGELIVFSGADGLYWFYPENLDISKEINNPTVSGLSFHEELNHYDYIGSYQGVQLDELKSIQLNHSHSLLKINLSSYEYVFSNTFKMRYRIPGVIDEWVEVETGEPIVLNRLPIGHYQLQMNASSLSGRWLNDFNQVSIEVLPPWYLSNIAKISYLLSAIIIVLVFYYFKTRRLQMRANQLAKAVDLRTRELAEEKQNVEHLLQTKNREFANVSHEFRTPLTLVLGPVTRLLEQEPDNEKKNKLTLVKKNTFRLMRMVDQLIYLEKLRVNKAMKRKPVPVSQLYKFITDSFEDLCLLRNIKFRVEFENDIWCLSTKESVEKVILNLLSNALKYTPEYGEIRTVLCRKGESFEFLVEDTGLGIPSEQQSLIFERFERVNDENSESITGAGIGLSLVKELLDQHNATIELSSQLGEGSIFTVTWPRIEAPIEGAMSEILSSEAVELELESLKGQSSQFAANLNDFSVDENDDNRALILVIEDNADMREYIKETVNAKYRCITAKNGAEGIELACEHIPDLIISDVMMPKQDGFAVSESLKNNEKTSHIPIILLTARGDKESRMTGWQKNVDEYLTKPFDEDELLLRIDNLLSIREILRHRFAQQTVQMGLSSEGVESLEQNVDVQGTDDNVFEISSIDQRFLSKLDETIDEHYSDNKFNAAKLALTLGYSERQLQRKLKSLIDYSPNEYLRHFRLNKAHSRLEQGDLIKVVAFECGFSTVPHFSSCFKAKFGKTPKQVQGN